MPPMNAKKVLLKLRDGTVLRGTTNIGNSRRLSDFFNRSDNNFIVLFDVSMKSQCGEGVIFLNKNEILYAVPQDERTHTGTEELEISLECGRE